MHEVSRGLIYTDVGGCINRGVCLVIDAHLALVCEEKEIAIEFEMAGIYLLPGSKADDTNMTESPPVSLHDFCQIYARQDDPITQINDDYYISMERFIMAPQTRRVAFAENNWDLGKINADVLVSFYLVFWFIQAHLQKASPCRFIFVSRPFVLRQIGCRRLM